mgnify:CR=1 FL=1
MGIVSNLFKSLNVSQPAERSVEDYISTLGGQTKFPLAGKMEQSELVKENLDGKHEDIGYEYLKNIFKKEIIEPIKYHVQAKRYLARDEKYFELLSEASKISLKL